MLTTQRRRPGTCLYHKLKKSSLLALATAGIFWGGSPATALDAYDGSNGIDFGFAEWFDFEGSIAAEYRCFAAWNVRRDSSGSFYQFWLDVERDINDFASYHYPGGGYYFGPDSEWNQDAAPITAATIALCANVPTSAVTEFSTHGAGFPSGTAAGDFFGFEFQLDGWFYRVGVNNYGAVNTRVRVGPENTAPSAQAGPDQAVASAAPVTLDGSASSDPDEGQTLTYAWTAPAGVTLSDPSAVSPTFTAPTLATGDPDQTLTFSLIVTDNLGLASVADEVSITVTAPSDTVAPDAPTLVVSGNPDGTVTASGTAEPGSVVKVTFPDGSTATTTAAEDGSYTVTSAAAQPSGDVTATATDDAGNVSPEATKPYAASNTVSETQEQIAGFMLGRANNLASNQPGLARFLMGDGCGNFNASANEGSGSVSGCVTRGNTWAEINGSWSGDGSYTLGTIGAHASLNPNLLVGGMVQFDYTDDPANNASGKGWMVGPYFVAKTPNQSLYFEGRLLYGQTDNEITPLGTYTDSFETERLLAQLRASGQFELKTPP